MKRPQRYQWVLLGSMILSGVCVGAAFAASSKPSPAEAKKVAPNVISVQTQVVKQITVEDSIKALGTLAPSQEVTLSFDAAGHITKINYKNGQRVEKGAVIAELNNASEEAELKSLVADAQVKKLDYERYLKLSKIGGVSDQQLDTERASMVQAEAKVEGKKVELDQRKLVAPFTGFLGEFKVNLGAYVATGQAIVHLVAISPLKVDYSVPQGEKSRLLLGQSVNVKSDASNQLTTGLVQFISPTVNTDTGTIAIEAEIPNKDYKLSPGMYVSVMQLLGNQHSVLIVPETAVSVNEKGASVYIVDNQGIAHFTQVTLGKRDEGDVEVLSGLKAGQQVVVAGSQKLKDGQKVKLLANTVTTKTNNTTNNKTTDKATQVTGTKAVDDKTQPAPAAPVPNNKVSNEKGPKEAALDKNKKASADDKVAPPAHQEVKSEPKPLEPTTKPD